MLLFRRAVRANDAAVLLFISADSFSSLAPRSVS